MQIIATHYIFSIIVIRKYRRIYRIILVSRFLVTKANFLLRSESMIVASKRLPSLLRVFVDVRYEAFSSTRSSRALLSLIYLEGKTFAPM